MDGELVPKTRILKRRRDRIRQHYWKNYSSVLIKGPHKIKIGVKPSSPITEEFVEDEVNRLPTREFSKVKRINMADQNDHIHKLGQCELPQPNSMS